MVQIYGTLGPACSGTETLARLFEAGMTGVRLNLSHVGLPGAAEQIRRLHAAASSSSTYRARSSGQAFFPRLSRWRTGPPSAWGRSSPCPPPSCPV